MNSYMVVATFKEGDSSLHLMDVIIESPYDRDPQY